MYTVCAHSVAQLCPTLCDPMDCSPAGLLSMGFPRQEYWIGLPFPPPGNLPNSGTEPVSPASPALAGGFFSHCATRTCAQSWPTLCTPWTVAHQAPLSMGFFRQEYWSGLAFPSPHLGHIAYIYPVSL